MSRVVLHRSTAKAAATVACSRRVTLTLSPQTLECPARICQAIYAFRRTRATQSLWCRLTSGFRLELATLIICNEKVPLAWEDRACLGSCPSRADGTFQMKSSTQVPACGVR